MASDPDSAIVGVDVSTDIEFVTVGIAVGDCETNVVGSGMIPDSNALLMVKMML